MAEEIKHKGFGSVYFKAIGDDGTVEAIVSVFNVVDSYNERCILGCFQDSLSKKLPKGVWMHDWGKPICKTIEARELAPGDALLPDELKLLGGLYVKGQFHPEITDSWQAYLKIKNGYVDEYSFGYRNLKTSYDESTGIRDLLAMELYEWSPVLIGANRATATLSVKQDLMDGPVGMSIEEHTELLLKRIETRHAAREAEGTLTGAFVNRLRETGEKIIALADSAKARDAAAPESGTTKSNALEWAQLTHLRDMRAIRSKAS